MKLSEIRESYEVLSGTFSKSSRTLALSGIAIAWFFLPYFKYEKILIIFIIIATISFVLVMTADLLQNYLLSKKWYDYYILMKETFKKKEEDDIKENEDNNKWGWRLYHSKFWALIVGYILLLICFVALIIKIFNEPEVLD